MWFLLIPPAALILALVWFTLRSRPDRTSEAMITIEGYRRGMAALARPISAGDPASIAPVSPSVTTLAASVPVPVARPADPGPTEPIATAATASAAVAESEPGGVS